jgi:hypothetical protein
MDWLDEILAVGTNSSLSLRTTKETTKARVQVQYDNSTPRSYYPIPHTEYVSLSWIEYEARRRCSWNLDLLRKKEHVFEVTLGGPFKVWVVGLVRVNESVEQS